MKNSLSTSVAVRATQPQALGQAATLLIQILTGEAVIEERDPYDHMPYIIPYSVWLKHREAMKASAFQGGICSYFVYILGQGTKELWQEVLKYWNDLNVWCHIDPDAMWKLTAILPY